MNTALSGGPGTTVAPARRVAFEILQTLGTGRGHSDELLHSSRLDRLSSQDRNLATALVMGVLRWQISLDARLHALFARPDQRVADEVLVALRVGAFQLLHMDRIPAHAALSESVALVKAAGHEHAAGMVNAILRRLTRDPRPGKKLFESTAAFAERLGHPAWLAERWVNHYGRTDALRICEADQLEPGPGRLFTGPKATLHTSTAITGEDASHAKCAESPETATPPMPVMDDGSRLVAELAAVALPELAEETLRVWDCCAAPGGKTMVLARRLPAAEILATDISSKRLSALEQRIGPLAAPAGEGGNVRCLVADAATLTAAEGPFDLVLCDVPCSGTGTLARNPEIRLRLRLEDLPRQAQRQGEILAAAMLRVAEGGRLVYATCSLEPEECEAVVDAVARGWHRIPLAPLMEALQHRGILRADLAAGSMLRNAALRTLPGVHGCDGFFAVVLERNLSA